MSTLMIVLAILAVLLAAASLATVISFWRLVRMDIKEEERADKIYCIDLGASMKKWFDVTDGEIRDGNKVLLDRDEYATLKTLLRRRMYLNEKEILDEVDR